MIGSFLRLVKDMQAENNDDLIYHKDLSQEQIRELEKQSKAHKYEKSCITAAFFGFIIAIFAALLLGISLRHSLYLSCRFGGRGRLWLLCVRQLFGRRA